MISALTDLSRHFRANPLSALVGVLLTLLVLLGSYFLYHNDIQMRRQMLAHDQVQHLQLQRLLLEQHLQTAVRDLRHLSSTDEHREEHDWFSLASRTCNRFSRYLKVGVWSKLSGEHRELDCESGIEGGNIFPVDYVAPPHAGIELSLVGSSLPEIEQAQVRLTWPEAGSAGEGRRILGLAYPLAGLADKAGIDHHNHETVMIFSGEKAWRRYAEGIGLEDRAAKKIWLQMHEAGGLFTSSGLISYQEVAVRDPMDGALITSWKLVSLVDKDRLDRDYLVFFRHISYVLVLFLILVFTLFQYSRGIIGEQARMLDVLRQKQIFLDELINSSPDAMVTVALDGDIVACNTRTEFLFGYDPGELEGEGVESLLPSDYQLRDLDYTQRYQSLTRSKGFERDELIAVRREGDEFQVEVTFCRLASQKTPLLLLIIREITEQSVAERELESLRLQYFQQEKMAQIGLLVAGVLHEVGNPLAAIQGLLEEVLSDDAERPEPLLTEHYLKNIELVLQQTDRIRSISRDISGFASPNQPERGLMDLNGILVNTTRLLSYDKRWRDITLDLELDPKLPALEGKSDQLTQVFMNLLVNASDAFAGLLTDQPRVVVRSRLIGGDIILVEIVDNGSGISVQDIVHIFEPFYTTKPKDKGTGLGLSICEKLVEEHQGCMEIESVPDQGTRVGVYFEVLS